MKASSKNQEILNQDLKKSQQEYAEEGDLIRWRENVVVKLEKANPWGLNWKGERNTGLILKITDNIMPNHKFSFIKQAEILWEDRSISYTSLNAVERINE